MDTPTLHHLAAIAVPNAKMATRDSFEGPPCLWACDTAFTPLPCSQCGDVHVTTPPSESDLSGGVDGGGEVDEGKGLERSPVVMEVM
ncbi:unnamed protein product [Merluccius merluccius]